MKFIKWFTESSAASILSIIVLSLVVVFMMTSCGKKSPSVSAFESSIKVDPLTKCHYFINSDRPRLNPNGTQYCENRIGGNQ